jgi:RNA polymerase sigma factor (TIGR02999 family)
VTESTGKAEVPGHDSRCETHDVPDVPLFRFSTVPRLAPVSFHFLPPQGNNPPSLLAGRRTVSYTPARSRLVHVLVAPMSEVTRILSAIEEGDAHAAEKLLPLVYSELRMLAAQRLAQEKAGQTLQATALVHEAYLRLVDVERAQAWNSRGHFFAAAAEAMRRILVERARRKGRIRHGGRLRRADLLDAEVAAPTDDEQILHLDEALGRLAAARPQAAELVKLRFFGGLTLEEVAPILGLSPRTSRRLWAFARAWLRRDMERSSEVAP